MTINPEVMNAKDLLLVEQNQFEEELIDDPEIVNDNNMVENEIELSNCIIQTEEVLQIAVDEEETLDTNTNDHRCTICGKELLSAYTLANHMRSHTGERPYGCSVCEKFFKTKSNLNEHYRVHNPELRWMKTSSRDIPSITRVTVTSEDMLTCGQCSKVFVTLDELSEHERTHAEHREPAVADREPRPAGAASTTVAAAATASTATATATAASSSSPPPLPSSSMSLSPPPSSSSSFTCEQCNRRFTSKAQLSAHISGNCADVGAGAGAGGPADRHCPYCGKRFRSAATLENHKRVHTREKPYACDVCTKPFRTKGNLLEHKRVHDSSAWMTTGIKTASAAVGPGGLGGPAGPRAGPDQRFQCTYCSKPFRTYTALLNHERVHTREKPFECSVCGKCFRTKSNLTEHMKGCHDMDSSAYASDEVQVFTFKTHSAASPAKLQGTVS